MKFKIYIAAFFLTTLFSACSDYNKIVRGDDYQLKFQRANELYESKKYDRCIVLYEQIYQHTPKTGEGELAYYRIAKSYFESEDYYMSGYYFGAFIQRFPFSAKTEESYFYMALSNVKNSPQFMLDQTETMQAITSVQSFIDRYPGSKLVDTCNVIIDQLRFKIERKDYEQVKLYARTDNFRSAVTAAEIFLENYSRSKFCEEVNYILVKNSYLLAINSIPAKKMERLEQTTERINNFAILYKNSKYLKELDALASTVEKEKNKNINSKL